MKTIISLSARKPSWPYDGTETPAELFKEETATLKEIKRQIAALMKLKTRSEKKLEKLSIKRAKGAPDHKAVRKNPS